MPALSSQSAARAPLTQRALSGQSDEELLVGLKQGTEAHFSELYARYFNRIYTFSYARVRNHADAEEIAQETFLAVFQSVASFRGQASLLSWIYGIAKNTANNQLRRQKTQELRLDSVEPERVAPSLSFAHSGPGEQFDMGRVEDVAPCLWRYALGPGGVVLLDLLKVTRGNTFRAR